MTAQATFSSEFSGQVALVTEAASGIGAASALALAARGAQAGRIDMLVAAAGIGFSGPLLSSDDAWARLKKLQARWCFCARTAPTTSPVSNCRSTAGNFFTPEGGGRRAADGSPPARG